MPENSTPKRGVAPIVIGLIGASILVNAVASTLAAESSWSSPTFVLYNALLFSQISFLGVWLGAGAPHGLIRIVVVGIGGVACLALSPASPLDVPLFPTFLVLQLVVLGFAGWSARCLAHSGWTRAEARENSDGGTHRLPQFTIVQVLQLTTFVAVLAGLARVIQIPRGDIFVLTVLFSNNCLVAAATCWWAIAPGPIGLRLATMLFVAGLLGNAAHSGSHVGNSVSWMAMNQIQVIIIGGWIAACRTMGVTVFRTTIC